MQSLFITGGGGDIGGAIKEYFAGNDFKVLCPTKQELNLEHCRGIDEYISKEAVDCDVFIHCAGFNEPKELGKIMIDDMIKTMNINCISFIEIARLLACKMKVKKYGRILAISSLYGRFARTGRMSYTASKHALNGAVKTIACEYGRDNVLANSLSPGFIDTRMTRKNNTREMIGEFEQKIPLRRLGTPLEVAKLAFFLCSTDNTYITGQDIVLDGGFMASGGQK